MKLDLQIEGPESIAISPNGKEIYTGIVGGAIVRIDGNGKVTFVAKFGQDCGMIRLKAEQQHVVHTSHVSINLQKANGRF